MDSDGLPMIGSGVDYTQVGAIHQKRTLAFINYFVTNTVSFLNNFSRACEVKLQNCESKIQKLEASIEILEAKLSSIPGLEEKSAPVDTSQNVHVEPTTSVDISSQVSSVNNVEPPSAEQPRIPEVPSGMISAKEHPTYKKFFRMLHFGVPEPGVKLKMQAEGVDPEMLSNPDQLVPMSNDLFEQTEGVKTEESSDNEMD